MKLLISLLLLALTPAPTLIAAPPKVSIHAQCQICGVAVDGVPKKWQHRSTDGVTNPQALIITTEAKLTCPNGHSVSVPFIESVPKVPTTIKTVTPPTKAEAPRAIARTRKLITPLPPMPAIVWQKHQTNYTSAVLWTSGSTTNRLYPHSWRQMP